MSTRFEIVTECPVTRARTGLLRTAHGTIETPLFMPVGTLGSVKGLTQRMLSEELGAQIVLANTYHLFLRPGHETIAKLGGLHSFINWDGAILTDSGGFQVFSLSSLCKVIEEGVVFRSHLDGSEHIFTPESTVDVQWALGSDVMMMLDECTDYPVSKDHARSSMERTIRWADRGFQHWQTAGDSSGDEAMSSLSSDSLQPMLFPIVQGSMFPDLRRECAERLVDMDAPGYAIGGLSVGEDRRLSFEMVEAVEDVLPRVKPRYVMGVGALEELAEYVARGVDMMDCVLPTRNARNGYLFTSEGSLIIKNSKWKADDRPLDKTCRCYTCLNYSRAYLRHLFLAGEMLFCTLATLHNLTAYLDRLREIREAIQIGEFPAYLARVRSANWRRL
ncbi:MAG: tRNA guanosine(34) transglycosylase Tgt [Solibacterales bacterium]|nr:tRNA guanosine(34) transglycosylase Tgt [Bryobacterales bacterium]|tara:strand:+ start:2601 stop:3770 length:1170 start_codon:yes stop_codon:yes gene_type:complete